MRLSVMGHRYDTRYNRRYLSRGGETEEAVATPFPFRVNATPISGPTVSEEERRPVNLEFDAFGRYQGEASQLPPHNPEPFETVNRLSNSIPFALQRPLHSTILTNRQERATLPVPRPPPQSNTPLEQEQTPTRFANRPLPEASPAPRASPALPAAPAAPHAPSPAPRAPPALPAAPAASPAPSAASQSSSRPRRLPTPPPRQVEVDAIASQYFHFGPRSSSGEQASGSEPAMRTPAPRVIPVSTSSLPERSRSRPRLEASEATSSLPVIRVYSTSVRTPLRPAPSAVVEAEPTQQPAARRTSNSRSAMATPAPPEPRTPASRNTVVTPAFRVPAPRSTANRGPAVQPIEHNNRFLSDTPAGQPNSALIAIHGRTNDTQERSQIVLREYPVHPSRARPTEPRQSTQAPRQDRTPLIRRSPRIPAIVAATRPRSPILRHEIPPLRTQQRQENAPSSDIVARERSRSPRLERRQYQQREEPRPSIHSFPRSRRSSNNSNPEPHRPRSRSPEPLVTQRSRSRSPLQNEAGPHLVPDTRREDRNRFLRDSNEPRPAPIPVPMYKKGDSIPWFINRFRSYLERANIRRENLDMHLLDNICESEFHDRIRELRFNEDETTDPTKLMDYVQHVMVDAGKCPEALRIELSNLKQGEWETIEEFAARIRKTARYAFPREDQGSVNRRKLDVLQDGMRNREAAEIVYQGKETDHDFDTVVTAAIRREANLRIFRNTTDTVTSDQVFAVQPVAESTRADIPVQPQPNRNVNRPVTCSHCDRRGHTYEQCYRRQTCQLCNTLGHIASHCRQQEPPSDPIDSRGSNSHNRRGNSSFRGSYRGSNHRGNGGRGSSYRGNSSRGSNQGRFPSVRCYECNEMGHYASDCSQRLFQSENAGAVENSESTGFHGRRY